MFKGIKLLSEDCEWVDSLLNTKGTVNQGAIYRKMAMLSEYAPTNSFENNSCHIKYKSMKKEILPLGDDDFIAEFPSENKTDNILDVLQNEYGEQSFYYTLYDASVDGYYADSVHHICFLFLWKHRVD